MRPEATISEHSKDAGDARSVRAGAPVGVPRWAIARGWWLAGVLGLLAAALLDRAAYHALLVGKEIIEAEFWYQAGRGVGTLWFWIAAGLGAGAVRRGSWRVRVRTALLVFLGAGLAGLGAEVLKVLVGRERPLLHDGSTIFKPLMDLLVAQNLSFPSSHASVAFGGAFMALRLARARGWRCATGAWVLMGLAAACGLSRTLTGAHFLSDVVGGMLLGAGMSLLVRRAIPGRLARLCPEVFLLRRRFRFGAGAGRAASIPS